MNIFKIVFSNIRKRKAANITFLVMVIFASLMLSISISLIIGSNSFFDDKVEELNSPHYSCLISEASYQDKFKTFAEDYDGQTDVSVLNALLGTGSWKLNSQDFSSTVILLNKKEAETKSFQKLGIIDKQTIETEDMIILPLSFRSDGFQSGDTIRIKFGNNVCKFTIYGFYEDPTWGASTTTVTQAYIGNENFNKLKNEDDLTKQKNLAIRLDKSEKSKDFQSAFKKSADLPSQNLIGQLTSNAKDSAMTFVNIAIMVLLLFSSIILIITFIVVRFSINNMIHEDVRIIGAFKSIGYKDRTLRGIQLLQYLLLAAFGSIIGSLISLLSFGLIGDIIASTAGLLWLNKVNIATFIFCAIIICVLISLTTLFITRRFKKITPVNALSQGEAQHSFRKNTMPLERCKGSLNLHLGMKRGFKNLKMNATLFLVISLLVFVSSVVFTMSYNLNTDKTAMLQLIGLEETEVMLVTNSNTDIKALDKTINSNSKVDRTILTGTKDCEIEKSDFQVSCFDDYSLLTVDTIIEGRAPKLYNEIALSTAAATETGKGVGDTTTVRIMGKEMNYTIVGITQDITNKGMLSKITTEAMRKHDSKYTMDTIYVYLNEGVNVKDYIKNLEKAHGNEAMIIDMVELLNQVLDSLGEPFATISSTMIFTTVLIIGTVLFLLISALIQREKQELGILKAIGYQNGKLMLQILISVLPSFVLGITSGMLLGFFLTNSLLSLALSTMGLLSTYFIIPSVTILLIGLGIFGASILMTYLILFRLKKISPQKLILEY